MANEKRMIDATKVLERADEVTFMGFRAEERKKETFYGFSFFDFNAMYHR